MKSAVRPYTYHLLSCAILLVCLSVDARFPSLGPQTILGFCLLSFLIIAMKFSPPDERFKVLILLVIATLIEVDCSLLWGVYRYRLGDVPLYVPPGHGIVYLFGLRWARTPIALKPPAALAWFAIVGASAWAAAGLTLSPMLAHRPDVLGTLCVPVLAWFVLRPSGSVYAGVFLVTSLLELVGTGLGDWTWTATAPMIRLPVGNPPAAIAAAYCAMDFTSSKLARWIRATDVRLQRTKSSHRLVAATRSSLGLLLRPTFQ